MTPVDRPVRPEGDDTVPEFAIGQAVEWWSSAEKTWVPSSISRVDDEGSSTWYFLRLSSGVRWVPSTELRATSVPDGTPRPEMPLPEAEGWLDYWETVGLSSDPAALDERAAARAIRAELKRLRASAAPETSPARSSDVEAWLKQQRDFNDFDTTRYLVIDELLDDYRLHADTGTPLSEHACDGPTCCSYLEARDA